MKNWFPLNKSMMEDSQEFQQLTSSEKLYYIFVLNKFNSNLYQPFYMSDLLAATTLGLSEVKVRKARKKCEKLGFLTVKSGFMTSGKKVATTYLKAMWMGNREGDFFAQIHRYAFETMLDKMRKGIFKPDDVLVYVYLCYLYWKNRGKKGGEFYISKLALIGLTNVGNAASRVRNIYDGFQFRGGAHLFEFKDEYRKIIFTFWSIFEDPSEGENNRKLAEYYEKEIADKISKAKRLKDIKDIPTKDLLEFFEGNGGHKLGIKQVKTLVLMAERDGTVGLQKNILLFLWDRKGITFSDFQRWLDDKEKVI